jgi:ATP-binding cassette subfamily G (WHITE) protein 2 (SNQ2)
VPNGPEYSDPAYQSCAFSGAQAGSLSIPGSRYVSTAFNYSRSHLWRNFGVG